MAKKFLEEHPEELKIHGSRGPHEIGFKTIASFLNWNEHRVHHSLERLNLIEENIIDKEQIERLPTERSARDFVKAVKESITGAPMLLGYTWGYIGYLLDIIFQYSFALHKKYWDSYISKLYYLIPLLLK